MKPAPRSRHILAVLILAAASAVSASLAMYDDDLSDSQLYIAAAAAKRYQPDLFSDDPVFGSRKMWLLETPAFQGLLELVLVPTGYQDLTLPFRALTGVITMLFLCGMYALLYRQCRSWSVAVFVALLSATVTQVLGEGRWGIGPLAATTPEGLCLAVVPLVMATLLHYAPHVRVLIVFGFVGLLGNLHLATAMNLTIVLFLVYLGMHRFSPRCWPVAIGGLMCALAGALPYLLYYIGLRVSVSYAEGQATYHATIAAFQVAERALLYPDILTRSFDWQLLARLAVLAVGAGAVLLRVERFRVRDARAWVWFLVAALWVAFGLHGASQLVGLMLGQPPPIIDFVRAGGLVMLPLYVLFAQGTTNLFRLVRVHRNYLRWACVVLLAVWMVPSDNLRVARHAGYELVTAATDATHKPPAAQRHSARRARHAELTRMAEWARDNTDPHAVFLTDEAAFRMLARRAVLTCRADVGYYYYMMPSHLGPWSQTVTERIAATTADSGRADPEALVALADELSHLDALKAVKGWYSILPAPLRPNEPGPMKILSSPQWGQYYVLCRLK